MPVIRPSADLRNKYNEISEFCHSYKEPVFITKNGQGDLAVMSIETYEILTGKLALYNLLDEGLHSVETGKTRSADDVLSQIKEKQQSRRQRNA